MSVQATIVNQINVQETLETGVDGASQPIIEYNAFNTNRRLDSTTLTTGPASIVICRTFALVAGALTLDLTAIVGANGKTYDATGQKVQVWRVKNLGANAMTFGPGASNGYLLKGAAWKAILQQYQSDIFDGYEATPDIDGTHKTIDIAGTGTQTFQLTLVTG